MPSKLIPPASILPTPHQQSDLPRFLDVIQAAKEMSNASRGADLDLVLVPFDSPTCVLAALSGAAKVSLPMRTHVVTSVWGRVMTGPDLHSLIVKNLADLILSIVDPLPTGKVVLGVGDGYAFESNPLKSEMYTRFRVSDPYFPDSASKETP